MGKYLHGYTPKEQNRLLAQAEHLESFVYPDIDLHFKKNLLEVGCGVGAQTKILRRRFPKLKITGLDFSEKQLAVAKHILSKDIKSGYVKLHQQDAQRINLKSQKFDSAFICWFLEHVPDPLKVLKGVFKHLEPGARIYCTEVFNQAIFIEPYSPATLEYLKQFNDYQWSIKGHPYIGVSLGNLLKKSGFKDIEVNMHAIHFDSREPQLRAEYLAYFEELLLSAEKVLLSEGRITKELVKEVKREIKQVQRAPDSVYFLGFMRATATR